MLLKEEKNKNSCVCYFDSSNILAAKYRTDTKQLAIIFKSGSEYIYDNVSMYVFARFKVSKSQGVYFNQHIKKEYKYSKSNNNVDATLLNKLIADLKSQK